MSISITEPVNMATLEIWFTWRHFFWHGWYKIVLLLHMNHQHSCFVCYLLSTPIALALLLCLNLFTTYTVSPYYPRFYSGKCFPIWRSKSPNMDIYSSHPLVTSLQSYNLLCLISLAMSHQYLTSFRDTCPHCPRTFQWRIGLISHLRTHMP